MRVLYLTPWYPSERDAMAGLFVQKHADAVRAQGVDVQVIHSQTWRDMFSQWKQLRREGWKPDVVQLNVIQKQGLLALWLKRRYGIPYVIVEHWSGYLPENRQYMCQNGLKRRLCEEVAAYASVILPVSELLGEAMRRCGIQNANWQKINNVVDDFFYQESGNPEFQNSRIPQLTPSKSLLHVSCFDERSKNTFALLRGFSELCRRRKDVQLVMVGTGIDYLSSRNLAKELAIPSEQIVWPGEQTPEQVCEWFHKADAFVLTSRYETAGIVLSEAAATGTPILSTPVGIAEELITQETGILVSQEQANTPTLLADAMEQVLRLPKYVSQAQEYSFASVGKQLKEVYMQCLVSE